MSIKYTYSTSVFTTSAGVVDLTRLTEDIQLSDITVALGYINKAGSICDTWFKAALSSAELITLSGVLAAHTGEPLVDAGNVRLVDEDMSRITEVDDQGRLKVTIDYEIHDHDDLYYTEDEVDTISGTLQYDIDNHLHEEGDITDLDKYTQTEVDALIASASGTTDHSALDNLDYASSGHTGFVSTADLTSTSGVLQTAIDAKPDYLDDLLDVNAPSPTDYQVLTWSGSKWVPREQVSFTGGSMGEWEYKGVSADTDPGVAKFKVDNSDQTSITEIYLNNVNKAAIDLGNFLDNFENGDRLYLQKTTTSAQAYLYLVTSVTDNTTYHTFSITYEDDTGIAFNDKDKITFVKFAKKTNVITDHSDLDELDYASSGHTGFAEEDHDHSTASGVVGGPLPCLQVRRTTPYYFTTSSYVDIPIDTTDIENNTDVLEHNNTNTDRVDIKEDGYYKITYTVSVHPFDSVSEFWTRVRVNDTTVVSGSEMFVRHIDDIGGTSDAFIDYLYDGDFITLQAKSSNSNGHTDTDIVMTVVKLQGFQGPQGPAGSGSSLTVKDEGSNVANTPHTDLNFVGDGVSVSDAGSGVATVNIAGGTASVFGSEFQEASSEGESSTTNSSYQLKIRLTTGTVLAGTYRIGWSYEWISNTTLIDAGYNVDVDSGTIIHEVVPAPTRIYVGGTYYSISGFEHMALSNASHTIDLNYKANILSNGGTTYIRRARLEIWRVS
jgi:hypothetical protein